MIKRSFAITRILSRTEETLSVEWFSDHSRSNAIVGVLSECPFFVPTGCGDGCEFRVIERVAAGAMLAMIGRSMFPAAFRKGGGDRGVGGPDGGLERRPTSAGSFADARRAPVDSHARPARFLSAVASKRTEPSQITLVHATTRAVGGSTDATGSVSPEGSLVRTRGEPD
jgi:hypothetical protein